METGWDRKNNSKKNDLKCFCFKFDEYKPPVYKIGETSEMSKMSEATYQRKLALVEMVDSRILGLIGIKDVYSTEKYWIITISENYAHASDAKYSRDPSYEQISHTIATIKYDDSHSLEELQLVFTKAIYDGIDENNRATGYHYFERFSMKYSGDEYRSGPQLIYSDVCKAVTKVKNNYVIEHDKGDEYEEDWFKIQIRLKTLSHSIAQINTPWRRRKTAILANEL